MRIKLKDIGNSKLGDTKSNVKFLLFPKRIGREIRWFEFAKIQYTYSEYMVSYDMGGQVTNGWVATSWMPYDPVKDCNIYLNEGCVHVDGIICDIEECNNIKNRQ